MATLRYAARAIMPPSLSFAARLRFACSTFFRILADGVWAKALLASQEKELPPAEHDTKALPSPDSVPHAATPTRDLRPALQLLAALQHEGRFVDFLMQDITHFPDAEVGMAARVVHAGGRRALTEVLTIEPLRTEPEGQPLTLEAGFDATAIKLTGQVSGQPPFHGILRHRGWHCTHITLPELVGDNDATVLAQAEVEL